MISIVIPTLQKRIDVLENLIKTLNNDPSVGEIILIDNCIKGMSFNYNKLRVILPEKNMYVNLSWNLGVKEAKYDYVALLNDDIIISEKICSTVLKKIKEYNNIGIIGFSKEFVKVITDENIIPEDNDIILKKTNFINAQFGIAMFFKKDLYPMIPEDLKIWYGDCYIFEKFKQKYQNYLITCQEIYHYGSLTSSSKNLSPIFKEDKKNWNKIKYKWYHYLFYIEEYVDCLKLRFLGINIKIYNKK